MSSSKTHLEVPGTSHSRLMVAPPRLNLRRTGSYNHLDKGPLSATSSTYNFNHLFFSPPPSPSLPALVPRPRKSPTHPRPSRVLRLLAWTAGLLVIAYIGVVVVGHGPLASTRTEEYQPQEDAGMIGQDEVPDFPTPVMVSSPMGQSRWTVSIPEDYQFPLSIKDYAQVFEQCLDISARTRDARPSAHVADQQVLGSPVADSHFVDVLEAQQSGLLPGHRVVGQGNKAAVWHSGGLVGLHASTMAKPVCKQTMTFVLESTDAGLGKGLLLLWTMHGISKQQGREFFIDDTRWAYDKYTNVFQPPPIPSCRPPSRQEMIPCPAQARHLVVTPATALGLFPELAGESLPGESKSDYETRTKQLFELARQGYETLFQINNDEDRGYVKSRVREIGEKALKSRKVVVGAHVRHGDRHPVEEQYAGSYIPTHLFSNKAQEVMAAKKRSKDGKGSRDIKGGMGTTGGEEADQQRQIMMVVASDDPVVYESEEFAGSFRAQERIRLASKSLIQKVNPDRHKMHKFVDETFGWEGGFFAAMFWNLGTPLSAASPALLGNGEASALADERPVPSTGTLRLRSLVGRAYVMDLAVLAGASDVVVCTASATGCKLLAVMMGWERAMEEGNWVNVDGDLGWSGIE